MTFTKRKTNHSVTWFPNKLLMPLVAYNHFIHLMEERLGHLAHLWVLVCLNCHDLFL